MSRGKKTKRIGIKPLLAYPAVKAGAGVASIPLGIPLLLSIIKKPTAQQRMLGRTVAREMIKKYKLQGVKYRVGDLLTTLMKGGPHYDPVTKTIMNPTRFSGIAAHEVGHARIHKLFGKAGTNLIPLLSRFGLPAAAALTGLILAYSRKEKRRKIAPLVAAAGAAPMIAGELGASLIGVKNLIRTLGFKKGLKEAGILIPAFATYLLAAGIPALATYAVAKLVSRKLRKGKK